MASLIIVLLVLLVVAAIIWRLPIPNDGPFPIKNIILVLIGLIAIWRLLQFAGVI